MPQNEHWKETARLEIARSDRILCGGHALEAQSKKDFKEISEEQKLLLASLILLTN